MIVLICSLHIRLIVAGSAVIPAQIVCEPLFHELLPLSIAHAFSLLVVDLLLEMATFHLKQFVVHCLATVLWAHALKHFIHHVCFVLVELVDTVTGLLHRCVAQRITNVAVPFAAHHHTHRSAHALSAHALSAHAVLLIVPQLLGLVLRVP